MQRDFKGIWITKDIWLSKDLNTLEKVLLAEIDSLDGKEGCYASNRYFADFFGLSPNRISELIKQLEVKKYVKITYELSGKQITKRIIKVFGISKGGYSESRSGYSESRSGYSENTEDNNTINNTVNNTTTTTDEKIDDVAEHSFSDLEIKALKKEIDLIIKAKVTTKGINKMLDAKPIETIKHYMQNWDKFNLSNIENVAGFFVDCVVNENPIPTAGQAKVNKDTRTNFKQREYSDEYYKSLYVSFDEAGTGEG
jgi:hypothetical protein